MTTRRLIEKKLPLSVVNEHSAREKNINHGHIGSMHRWWARRPLAMSRAVVFGTLLPDPGGDARRKDILDLLALGTPFDVSVNPTRINPLRRLLAESFHDGPPTVLDCFAGGGAIPLEALRLGCAVTALDLNPVAHLIEKCALEYPQRFGVVDARGNNTLADDVVRWARWVRQRVEPKLSVVFPSDETGHRPAIYFWARTMTCSNPSCRAEIPLLSSYWLAKSTRRLVWVEVEARLGAIDLHIRTGDPPANRDPATGTVRASSVTCPACGTSAQAKAVREYGKKEGFGRRLYAVLDISGRQRKYRSPRPDEVAGAEAVDSTLLNELQETPDGTSPLPDEDASESSARIHRCFAYGFTTPRSYFNDRQLYVLGTLCEGVRAAYEAMAAEGIEQGRAVAIATYLGFVVDKIAEHNSAFTSYATNRESSRGTFPRQRMSMVWDHIETDPFHGAEGIWEGHVGWLNLAIRHCSTAASVPAIVQRGDAQHLPFPDESFDAVIVDPPYYDAIQYADLSDFFYVWLKRSVGHLHPGVFGPPLSPKRQEVIENPLKRGTPEFLSHADFEQSLERALSEMRRVVKPDGMVAIVFAHTDVQAWERVLRALRASGLVVSTSWPMRSERETRSTAQVSAVLGSSVVLVCRPQRPEEQGFFDDVVRELEDRIAERLDAFEEMGLVGADYFVSAIGPAFEVFARYSRVVKLSGEGVDVADLMVLARQVVARHTMRRLLGNESLIALDAESLFYLTWRWAYLAAAIPADEAYKLERAFDVDLSTMSRGHGFVRQAGSTFSLLGPHERKGLKLSPMPALIDVLHVACQLWDAGRRKELEELLGATGMGVEPGFWATARALGEVVPDGNKERTMLLGLTGNRDALTEAAARSTATMEALTLFDVEQ
ncbi:MAG: DUF1156 domain-containing protein [Actinomycetota bacterium]|nr:DUF1156 domain-containing protein [Actinomycetota bacterium]